MNFNVQLAKANPTYECAEGTKWPQWGNFLLGIELADLTAGGWRNPLQAVAVVVPHFHRACPELAPVMPTTITNTINDNTI